MENKRYFRHFSHFTIISPVSSFVKYIANIRNSEGISSLCYDECMLNKMQALNYKAKLGMSQATFCLTLVLHGNFMSL